MPGYKYSGKNILNAGIALVWLINGLFCKVINLVPRHQQIVSRILGEEYSYLLTKAIGVAEILMFAWIISGIRSRLCAVIQMIIVAVMNIIEFRVAPDLLLFGKVNIILAAVFIMIIAMHEFIFTETRYKKTS